MTLAKGLGGFWEKFLRNNIPSCTCHSFVQVCCCVSGADGWSMDFTRYFCADRSDGESILSLLYNWGAGVEPSWGRSPHTPLDEPIVLSNLATAINSELDSFSVPPQG